MDPKIHMNKAFINLKPNQLNCENNSIEKYSKHFIGKSDIKIRAIEWSRRRRNTLKIVWLVLNRIEDIALFRLLISNENNILVNETLEYNVREYVANNLNERQKYVICINTIDSKSTERPQFFSQCIQFEENHMNVENFVSHKSLANKITADNSISFAKCLNSEKFNSKIVIISLFFYLLFYFGIN